MECERCKEVDRLALEVSRLSNELRNANFANSRLRRRFDKIAKDRDKHQSNDSKKANQISVIEGDKESLEASVRHMNTVIIKERRAHNRLKNRK